MSAIADPSSVSGSGNGTITSGTSTVTVTGGTGPYTYGWVFQSGDSSISADSPGTAATSFTTSVSPGDSKIASFICTVTDSLLNTATSNAVNAQFTSV